MDSSRNAQGGKKFYIALDQPKESIFKGGDIVSGKCCLLSPVDEDVGSVTISFHGTIKVRFVDTDPHRVYGVHTLNHYEGNNHNSEDVLFAETKLLYQGPYTLRKNILYEWSFQFQFPSKSLPQSGKFGKEHFHSATIAYELEACRGKTSQDIASLEKRITPLNKYRDASMQSRTWFERLGSFTGMVATMPLQVLPPRKAFIEPATVTCEVHRQFPTRTSHSSASHHPGLSDLFHSRHSDAMCRILLKLPRNLVHDGAIPVFFNIGTDVELAPISLQTIEIHLKSSTTVISNLGQHRHTDELEVILFSRSKIGLALSSNCTLNIGKTLNLNLDPSIIPSFTHSRVEVGYSLRVHLVIECDRRQFEEDFIVEDLQILSNMLPNSPLRLDHLCAFLPEDRQNNPGPPQYPGIEEGGSVDFTDTYLCLSRLLTQNFIPHNPITSQTGDPTILLHGQPQLSDASPSQEASRNPWSQSKREDYLGDDQHLLDIILNPESGFKATTMRSGRASIERFGYSWTSPNAPPLSLKARVLGKGKASPHLEISTLDAEDEIQPPPYSRAMDPFSPITILNKLLRKVADSVAPRSQNRSNLPNDSGQHSFPSDHQDLTYDSDILYVISEHWKELQENVSEIDTKVAMRAAAALGTLRIPLLELGVNVDFDGVLASEDAKQQVNWDEYRGEEKGK